jgi:hypothetical protein
MIENGNRCYVQALSLRRFSIPNFLGLSSQIGEVIEQHHVDEDVATAHSLQESKSSVLVG